MLPSFAMMFVIAFVMVGGPITVLVVLHILWTRRERNLAVLISYLASVTSRGYPLAGALHALGRTMRGRFSDALKDISAQMEGGMSLSSALVRHPRVMPDDYVDLVHAGESAGNLADVFQVLRRHDRRTFSHRSRLFAVATYPLVLFWLAGSAGYLVSSLVVPRFREIAAEFGTGFAFAPDPLLLIWRVLIPLVFALTVMIVILAIPSSTLVRREGALGIADTLKWWLPPSRRYERYAGIRLFAQSLAIQLRGGVPLREALRQACQVVVNGAVRSRLERMRAGVEEGKSLSSAAGRCGLFPARFIHLMEMGETGGNMLPALDEIASSSTDACERVVTWISLIAVPAAVVATGGTVAVLGIGVFRTLAAIMLHVMGGSS
ncbi:MAG TPA: type II secretion system F family protein [Planctomycetota bacterium]|nr:type II secretion system F family protein [Planctomycetota bacterium]